MTAEGRYFAPVLASVSQRVADAGNLDSNARRLFHGRGHTQPGYEDITVDLFADQLLVSQFRGADDDVSLLLQKLQDLLPQVRGLTLQRRRGRRTSAEIIWGNVPERVQVREQGLSFWVELTRNQNVGLFLDMQPTRAWLRRQCGYLDQPKLLNLFAYTCAFSVVALAGGASVVVNNDMSSTALAWGRDNHRLNDQDLRQVRMLDHNLFKSWWKVRKAGPYDIVIIDPPSNQQGSFNAEKQYGQILKRLPEYAKPDAWVVACLNSPFLNADFVPRQMARWCPAATLVERLPNSPDFPDVSLDSALKVFLYRYRP